MYSNRVVVVTGAASGIGAATTNYLRERGARVITADLRDADVIANLTTSQGRAAFVEGVGTLSGGTVDAVIANAGGGPVETSVQLNFFGAVATLEGLRPLLARSTAPRAVAVSSIGSLFASRQDLVDACLAGDEAVAVTVARRVADDVAQMGLEAPQIREAVYGNAKLALNHRCRALASSVDWAGAGILLNVVALGLYDTPAAAFILRDRARRKSMQDLTPLRGALPGRPEDAAALLSWLTSPENAQLTGQVLFADGGFESRLLRNVVPQAPRALSAAMLKAGAETMAAQHEAATIPQSKWGTPWLR
jgi:NAD(P)-dependent dehydrogenase (short-subunit alcohol dehydrogenase family)